MMNKFVKTALIILIAAFSINVVSARTLDSEYVKAEVVKAVEADLTAQGFEDIEVKVLGVPFQTLEIPNGEMKMIIVKNQGSSYSKRCIKPLRVYVGNQLIRAFGVPLEVKAYKQALVATKEIGIGGAVNSTNVALKKIEVDGNYTNYVGANELSGEIVSAKVYRVGQPIDRRFSKIKSDVQKDELVTVVFDTKNNMTVSIKAKALASGSKGDMVAVRNEDNKKVYYGEVINKNVVKVNI